MGGDRYAIRVQDWHIAHINDKVFGRGGHRHRIHPTASVVVNIVDISAAHIIKLDI